MCHECDVSWRKSLKRIFMKFDTQELYSNCEMWYSGGGDYEQRQSLLCCSMRSGRKSPTFQRNVLPPFAGCLSTLKLETSVDLFPHHTVSRRTRQHISTPRGITPNKTAHFHITRYHAEQDSTFPHHTVSRRTRQHISYEKFSVSSDFGQNRTIMDSLYVLLQAF